MNVDGFKFLSENFIVLKLKKTLETSIKICGYFVLVFAVLSDQFLQKHIRCQI